MADHSPWFYLPHRPPFLLVDRVVSVEPGRIVVSKRVSAGEEYGGWEDRLPPFPFALIAEAMAQAASMVAVSAWEKEAPSSGIYAAIKEMRVWREPQAGEELLLHLELLHRFGGLFEFRGEAKMGGELIGAGELVLRLS